MARKTLPELRREIAETFRPASVEIAPAARAHMDWRKNPHRDLHKIPKVVMAHDVASPVTEVEHTVGLLTARTLVICAAAIGGGYIIGRWLSRNKKRPAAIVPKAMPKLETVPDWAVT